MGSRHSVRRRKIWLGAVAGIALVALGGCYPYYYDLHYGYSGKRYRRGYGTRRYHGDGRHGHRDRHRRERRRRYRYYRDHW